MSIFEYNEAEEKEKLRRAEYAVGYEAGVAAGIEQGINQGIEKGLELKYRGRVFRPENS